MTLVRIEPDMTGKEASDWVYEFIADLFEHLDFEACVGVVNGEVLKEDLLSQAFHLEHASCENVAEAAVERLVA
jgi:hypothetical protein